MRYLKRTIFPILAFIYLVMVFIFDVFDSGYRSSGDNIVIAIIIVHFIATFLIIYSYFKNNKKKRRGIIGDKEVLYCKIYYLLLLMIFNILYFWIFLPFNEIIDQDLVVKYNGEIVYMKGSLLYFIILDSFALFLGSIVLYRLIYNYLKQIYTYKNKHINKILFLLFFSLIMYSKYIYLLRVYSIITTP